MILRVLFRDFLQRLPHWDRASHIALALALMALALCLILGFAGPQPIQLPARIGAFGTLLSLQLLFFWGSRGLISPYHQAQRHFVEGDYAAARDILEAIPESDRSSVDALVLLGNAYRHMVQLDQAGRALERALQLRPDYHFALYAMGKLRLVQGDFAESADLIERAAALGAPDAVLFEAGHACWLGGDRAKAERFFRQYLAQESDEPEKLLLIAFFRRDMSQGEGPTPARIQAHIGYWQSEADKYRATDYGLALQDQIDPLREWLGDGQGALAH